MKKIFFSTLAVLLFLTCWSSLQALDSPEKKLTSVMEQYVLAKYPHWQDCKVSITLLYADKTIADLAATKGEVEISVAETYKNLKPLGNVVFPLKITVDNTAQIVLVRAKVAVFKDVVIAQTLLHRGKIILPGDVVLASKDIALLPPDFFTSVAAVQNKEVTTTISAQGILFKWMAKDSPDVRRGAAITINIIGPNLLVQCAGVARSDGYLGQAIKVKSHKAKNVLDGILLSSTEVEVKL